VFGFRGVSRATGIMTKRGVEMNSFSYMKVKAVRVVPVIVFTGLVAGLALASGPEITKEAFPDYHPSHTVIKCPYIPPGLRVIPSCGGQVATCVGTQGHDLILGTENKDVIVALGGHDVVHGDANDDIICGGFGMDSLFGARGHDIMYGGPGNDWLFGAKENDSLYGGPGNHDVLWGGPGVDFLDGGPGGFDVCMLQREMGDFKRCNTVYPPPGYVHDEEPDPGVLKAAEPLKLK